MALSESTARLTNAERERQMIEFMRGQDAVYGFHRLEGQPGWGRWTVSNTLGRLYDKGVIVKVNPDAQPVYPVRLAEGA